jgi:uncharacterized membrane protein YfcA
MPDDARYALVALVVLLTHFQEGITGFGCTVLALPFVTMLLGLHVAVPVLAIQGWLLAALIVLESRRKIVWGEFGWILLLVGIGFPFGVWMFKALPESYLRWVLAAFMVVVGIQGFIGQYKRAKPATTMTARARLLTSLFLPLGGVIHGAFASGGPFVIIYAARALTDKTLFRVTMCMLWTVLGAILIGQLALSSRLTPFVWKMTGFCLPFTLVGLVLGNYAHYRVNEATFRKAIYAVLMASGIVMAYSLTG